MTPLERAARALCRLDYPDEAGGEMENYYFDKHGLAYIAQARAVLEAIREPSEGMDEAGKDADDHIEFNNHGRIWRAMIDAALTEV
jgi:hypothetical protein